MFLVSEHVVVSIVFHDVSKFSLHFLAILKDYMGSCSKQVGFP